MLRRLLIASVALLLPFAGAATAQADEVASRCTGRVIEQPFTQFGDLADYFLAPDGDLSAGGAGWELNRAEVVAENEPFWVHGDGTPASVWLDRGASATSPAICVERGFSSFRFVARSVGAVPGAVRVEVLHASGRVAAGGAIKPGAAWGVTPKVNLVEGLFNIQAGASTTVRLKFTASGGPVRIDDVYVDPRYRG